MTTTLDITDKQLATALHDFVLSVLPSGLEMIRGQTNRVAEPLGPDYIVYWPQARMRLATNVDNWDQTDPAPVVMAAQQSTQLSYQLDFHGPNGADYGQIVSTLWRDPQACAALAPLCAPLYSDDGHQVPFINGEAQYEDRWTIVLNLQANPIVSTAQQFADTVKVGLIEVDATFPPGA